MKPYKVYLWTEAAGVVRGAPAGQRMRVSAFIDSLGENPFVVGDYSERDESDREIQIKVIGKYAIAYWADHAVTEVKVVEIRLAD